MLESLKVQFLKSLRGDQGQGLHGDWLTGGLWDALCLLAGLAALWGCWENVGDRCDSPRVWTQLATERAGAHSLCPDLCISNRRIDLEDFLRRELDEGWASVLLWTPAESESEREKRAERDASSAAPSHRPFPSGPRNWAALWRQVEKPSWKECFWPPSPPSALLLSPVFCRNRTVCSRISAFSTLRWVASWDRTKELINSFSAAVKRPLILQQEQTDHLSCVVFTCRCSKRVFRLSRLWFILSLRRLSTWGLRLYETETRKSN